MTKTRSGCWLLALALVVPAGGVGAQCASCGVTILELTAGARPLGLGGAYVTGDGPMAIFHNPAQVGSSAGSTLNVSNVTGATLLEAATSGRLGQFGAGAGIRLVTDGVTPGTGDTRHLASGAVVARVALARAVHGVWLGGAASYVTTDLSRGAGGATFDVGAAVRRFGLLFGITGQNLGRGLDVDYVREPLPARVSAGVSLPQTSISTYFDFAASAALTRLRGGDLVPQIGGELSYTPVSGWEITARVGAHRVLAAASPFGLSGVSLGGSFSLDNLALDYAFVPGVHGGRPLHTLGLRIQ